GAPACGGGAGRERGSVCRPPATEPPAARPPSGGAAGPRVRPSGRAAADGPAGGSAESGPAGLPWAGRLRAAWLWAARPPAAGLTAGAPPATALTRTFSPSMAAIALVRTWSFPLLANPLALPSLGNAIVSTP